VGLWKKDNVATAGSVLAAFIRISEHCRTASHSVRLLRLSSPQISKGQTAMRMVTLCAIYLSICCSAYSQSPKPLTHIEACGERFSKPVVRIDNPDGRGSGFIVSSDGFILTAAHVVIDPNTGRYYRTIMVTAPHAWTEFATPVMNVTEAATYDFALIKIDKNDLPTLELGSEEGVEVGSDLTLIGFPFSALDDKGEYINAKFCLAGLVAAYTSFGVGKSQVDAVYFQGPSVKGISGSPIISNKTGKVIGVVSTKLTGIGLGLQNVRQDRQREIDKEKAGGVEIRTTMGGIDPAKSVSQIINVLDDQLANGLGMGTGASDAAYALKKAKRDYDKNHPKK
jgi:S1-C subfamily serine protease